MTAIAFGLIGLLWRPISPHKLTLLFALYALTHGALSLIAAIGGRGQPACRILGLEGLAGLAAGLLTLFAPAGGTMAAVIFIWLWALTAGALRMAEAIRLRKELSGDVWLMLSGLVTVLLAIILLLRPIVGAAGVALMIAGFALLWGVFELLLAWELRAARHGTL
jgi:uncharacterized membrane protein HdeD (DUF308 family)